MKWQDEFLENRLVKKGIYVSGEFITLFTTYETEDPFAKELYIKDELAKTLARNLLNAGLIDFRTEITPYSKKITAKIEVLDIKKLQKKYLPEELI